MARRRLHGLERVLGINALSATAYGSVGSSIYFALGLVAGSALGLTPVVFVITGAIFFCTAQTYTEATVLYPEAGGSASFARHAFNELWSFVAGWGQLLNYVITVSIAAFFVPHYIAGVWHPLEFLHHSPGDIGFAIVVIAGLAILNIRGAQESAFLNVFLALADFLTQVVLVVLGFVLVLSPEQLVDNVDLGAVPTWTDFLLAIPLAMIAYTGIETISNMAEEARDAARTVPAAINRVMIAVFAIYLTLPAVALSALPVDPQTHVTRLGLPEDQGGYAADPVLGVVANMPLGALQDAAAVYVAVLAATILLIAANAGLIGVSRVVYSMGVHRQVPAGLSKLHRTLHTPWIGIIVFGAVACVTVIPGQAEFLGNLFAFGALLSWTIAHIAVIKLRRDRPETDQPWRGHGNARIRGRDVPLFAVFGGLGTGVSWVIVTVLNPMVAAVGIGWMIGGVVLYRWYRAGQDLDLTTTVKAKFPAPVVDHEAEYDSVLVAFDESAYVPEVMATAVKLAAPRRRGIHVVVTITVPQASPIDAPLPEQEFAAGAVIEQAKLAGGRLVSGSWMKVRPREAGRRIVAAAKQMNAEAIVMPLPQRTNGTALFGPTLTSLLAERPCRIIVESQPAPRTQRRPPAA